MRPAGISWAVLVCAYLTFAPSTVLRGAEAPPQPTKFQYDAHGRRDPFVALVRDGRIVSDAPDAAGAASAAPVLYGIVWDPSGQSFALINDREVKVGETIAGYRVQEIRRDAVVLTGGAEPLVLQVFSEPPQAEQASGDGN